MLEKHKPIRLRGHKKHELRQKIFDRDKHCIIPGCDIEINNEWHHEPDGPYKSDELEKGVRLCLKHHRQRHDGPDSLTIKNTCKMYLEKTYCSETNINICRMCENILCLIKNKYETGENLL